MNLHELEEREYRDSPRLWDATPGVCCAAYQLGACGHTEAMDDEEWDESWDVPSPAPAATPVASATDDKDYPF